MDGASPPFKTSLWTSASGGDEAWGGFWARWRGRTFGGYERNRQLSLSSVKVGDVKEVTERRVVVGKCCFVVFAVFMGGLGLSVEFHRTLPFAEITRLLSPAVSFAPSLFNGSREPTLFRHVIPCALGPPPSFPLASPL